MDNRRTFMRRIVAVILIFVLTFADFALITMNIVTYASSTSENINKNDNIDFKVLLKNDASQKVQSLTADINDETISMDISVKLNGTGYLKNIKIKIPEDSNFAVKEDFKSENLENNIIKLSQINSNSSNEISIPISFLEETNRKDIFEKTNNITLTGIYVNSNGEEKEIEKTTSVILKWQGVTTTDISLNLEKNIVYNEGRIIQVGLKLKKSGEKKYIPIKSTHIEMVIPTIEKMELQDVKVSSQSSSYTVGKDGQLLIDENNFNYDESKIYLNIENTEPYYSINNGDTEDYYVITFMYKGKMAENQVPLSQINIKLTNYSNEEENINNMVSLDLNQEMGDIVTYNIDGKTKSLSKGNIYANYVNQEEPYETEYSNEANINISIPEEVKKVELKDSTEYFVDNNDKKYELLDSYYKNTILNKENLDYIIGEKGNLEIFDLNGTKLVTIDKNIESDEDGNIVISYGQAKNKLSFVINNPENAGIIKISNTKTIGKINIEKSIAKDFQKLCSEYSAQTTYKEDVVKNLENQINEIQLTGTTTNASLSINRKELSTIVTNQDVELTISLNNYNDMTDLYTNPVFEILLPNYIEEITVKSVNLLYGNDELKIGKIEAYKNKEGKILLRIPLIGNQKTYSLGEATDGTNIKIMTDMKLSIYTPSATDKMEMYYYNEDATDYTNKVDWTMEATTENKLINNNGKSDAQIEIVAPNGLINAQEIYGYKEGESIGSLNQGEKEAKIDTYQPSKIATMEMVALNNSKEKVTNVSILGRTIFEGNKDIFSFQELGTNVTAKMVSPINIEGRNVVIYYSENGQATRDLQNPDNGWKTDVTDFSNIKSFLIEVGDFEIGEIIRYRYNFEIPAELEPEKYLAGCFATYFIDSDGLKIIAPDKVSLTTGDKPNLKVEVVSNAGDIVTIGQRIKYTVKVTNQGTEEVSNVRTSTKIDPNTVYVEYESSENPTEKDGRYIERPEMKELQINIDNLKVGETKEISYEAVVKSIPEPKVETEENKDNTNNTEENNNGNADNNDVNNIIEQTTTVDVDGLDESIKEKNEVIAKENKGMYIKFYKSNAGELYKENVDLTFLRSNKKHYRRNKKEYYGNDSITKGIKSKICIYNWL